MDRWDFLKWRRTLNLTQVEAGQKLGVHRATIVNWERGITPIPNVVGLACLELTRRSKQSPEFGPVLLAYLEKGLSDPLLTFRCGRHPNNTAALEAALSLIKTQNGWRPMFIIGLGGGSNFYAPRRGPTGLLENASKKHITYQCLSIGQLSGTRLAVLIPSLRSSLDFPIEFVWR